MKTATILFLCLIGLNCFSQKQKVDEKNIPAKILKMKDSLFVGTEISEAWLLSNGNYEIRHHYDSLVFINSYIDSKSVWLSMQNISIADIPFTIIQNKAFPLLYINPQTDKFYLIRTSTGKTFYRLEKKSSMDDENSSKHSTMDFDLQGNNLEQFISY